MINYKLNIFHLKQQKLNLNTIVYDKLLQILIEKSRTKYMETTFKFLNKVYVYEDMILMYHPETDTTDISTPNILVILISKKQMKYVNIQMMIGNMCFHLQSK